MALRIGLIGLGGVAEAHLAAYKASDSLLVVAASEVREDRLQQLASQHGFVGYIDYHEMLDKEQLDVVAVLTPVNSHRAVVEDCARAGVNVFCEKPLAISMEDALAIVAACESAGVELSYGASYRYLPAIRKARELITEGVIGDVQLMQESIVGGTGPDGHLPMGFAHYPEGGPGGSGLGLVDHGVHLIDTFSWLSDSRVVSVTGRGNRSGEQPGTEFAYLAFDNGANGFLVYNDCTFSTNLPTEGIFSHGAAWGFGGYRGPNTWHEHPGSIHVHGSQGALRIFHYANHLFLTTASGTQQIPLEDRTPPAQFALQMEAFGEVIEGQSESRVGGQVGIDALRVLLGIYESQSSGKRVDLQ